MKPQEFRVCFFSSIMHLSCRLRGAEVTTLEAKGGRGDQGNKGASLNLAVVLSGKLAVGCSHMGAGPSLSCGSVSGNTKAHKAFGAISGCLFV